MRRAIAACVLALALVPRAAATPPAVSATATPAAGAAPLTVTLTASGDAVSYHWDLGDGTVADGAIVQHVYAAGSWTATVTATAADGETAQAQAPLRAVGLSLAAPPRGTFGKPLTFTGTALPDEPVAVYSAQRELAVGRTSADGSFRLRLRRLRSPGPYVARTAETASEPVSVLVHPLLTASFAGSSAVGKPLALVARLRPAAAGRLRVRIFRGDRLVVDTFRGMSVRIPLGTSRAATLRAVVVAVPAAGYLGARHLLRTTVVVPQLQLGATGPSVLTLEQRLAAMHYALRGIDSHFGGDTYEAVLAFQKVHGLTRTGRLDAGLWQRIFNATVPAARFPGNHVEIDKGRQVLFEVRAGKVALVVHVSTGATGNTPVGLWHVYRRVTGFDWVLYYPSYFLRGFAVHGYPSVPPYPASHGCVRIPMWAAQRVYSSMWLGEPVYVYA